MVVSRIVNGLDFFLGVVLVPCHLAWLVGDNTVLHIRGSVLSEGFHGIETFLVDS